MTRFLHVKEKELFLFCGVPLIFRAFAVTIEWTEAPPEDKDGSRRHQWIGCRNYLGQNQMLNVMLAGKGTNFEKHREEFAAIMYSMKTTK